MKAEICITMQQSSGFLSAYPAETCTGDLPVLGDGKERGILKCLSDAKLHPSDRITAGIRTPFQKL